MFPTGEQLNLGQGCNSQAGLVMGQSKRSCTCAAMGRISGLVVLLPARAGHFLPCEEGGKVSPHRVPESVMVCDVTHVFVS